MKTIESQVAAAIKKVALLAQNHKIVAAIGDIHGQFAALRVCLSIVDQLRIPTVFLGDYVDKGPDSLSTLETLSQWRQTGNSATYLLGNHELKLIEAIEKGSCTCPYDSNCAYNQLKAADQIHRFDGFLASLKPYLEAEGVVFVHGGIPRKYAETPLAMIPVPVLAECRVIAKTERVIVHGHAPHRVPTEIVGVSIALDTIYYGYLTIGLVSVGGADNESRLLGYVAVAKDSSSVEFRTDMDVIR